MSGVFSFTAMMFGISENLDISSLESSYGKDIAIPELRDGNEIRDFFMFMRDEHKDVSGGIYIRSPETALAAKERFEIDVVESFMPAAMSEEEIEALVDKVVSETGASGMQDMGRVMGAVKAAITGRADMALVSAAVKSRLS